MPDDAVEGVDLTPSESVGGGVMWGMRNLKTPDVRPGVANTDDWATWTSLPWEVSIAPPKFTGCERWLSVRFASLAVGLDLYGVAAAVGTVARLGDPGHASVAGQWARSLPERELTAIERMGVEKAGRLMEMENRDGWARYVVSARDELEGALATLRLAGRGGALSFVLRMLDEEVTVPVSRSELTRAVALHDPDAWWGCL